MSNKCQCGHKVIAQPIEVSYIRKTSTLYGTVEDFVNERMVICPWCEKTLLRNLGILSRYSESARITGL